MKFPFRFTLGVIALIIGLIGIFSSLSSHYTDAQEVVADYVEAINDGNMQEMISCTMASMGNINMNMNTNINGTDGESVDAKLQCLTKSSFSVPEGAVKINSIELIGCSQTEQSTGFGVQGYNVTALVEMTFEDAKGETQTTMTDCSFGVIGTPKGFKIAQM